MKTIEIDVEMHRNHDKQKPSEHEKIKVKCTYNCCTCNSRKSNYATVHKSANETKQKAQKLNLVSCTHPK